MALARFKDLCIDANDPGRLGEFWAVLLDRSWQPDAEGQGRLTGPTTQHTIWVNRVAEAKTVKHRVHIDMYAGALTDLEAFGSAVVQPQTDRLAWTIMTDLEGGEYCAFLRSDQPAERMHGLVVDSADQAAQADWWGRIYDVEVIHHGPGHSTVQGVPGMPILTMDFVWVPEAKTVKNRIHWDVNVTDLGPLVEAGATVRRPNDAEIRWNVMADPEGNEFCAFVDRDET